MEKCKSKVLARKIFVFILMTCTIIQTKNVATSCSGIDPKIYSDWVSVPTGSYRYISNWLYGNRKYAYPMVVIRQDNAIHKVSGKWSPDNISNRY